MNIYKDIINKKRNLFAAIGVSALLLIGAIVLVSSISGPADMSVFSFGNSGKASLSIHVVEGYSETPIKDASVVVIETGETYQTDTKGYTEVFDVPVIRDERYDKILSKPWGEVTLIIYKEGFMPYALFYLQVIDGQAREGVKILLFEQGVTKSSEPFSIIEGPNRLWVDELIKMYQPDE